LLGYHSKRLLIPAGAGCQWLLLETRDRGAEPRPSADWIEQWRGARPGDRSDQLYLYARR
jgi:hypothetical protein